MRCCRKKGVRRGGTRRYGSRPRELVGAVRRGTEKGPRRAVRGGAARLVPAPRAAREDRHHPGGALRPAQGIARRVQRDTHGAGPREAYGHPRPRVLWPGQRRGPGRRGRLLVTESKVAAAVRKLLEDMSEDVAEER